MPTRKHTDYVSIKNTNTLSDPCLHNPSLDGSFPAKSAVQCQKRSCSFFGLLEHELLPAMSTPDQLLSTLLIMLVW